MCQKIVTFWEKTPKAPADKKSFVTVRFIAKKRDNYLKYKRGREIKREKRSTDEH